MTYHIQPMTDEQRKAIALEYFRRLDTGRDIYELVDEHATMFFPKWGVARGLDQIRRMFEDVRPIFKACLHHDAYLNFIIQGDMVAVEGTTHGETSNGRRWRAGITHAGRFCNIFEIRDFKIARLNIYLDPDYGDEDLGRYPWLEEDPSPRG